MQARLVYWALHKCNMCLKRWVSILWSTISLLLSIVVTYGGPGWWLSQLLLDNLYVVHHHLGSAQRGLQILQYYQWPIDMEARHRGGSLLQSIYLINFLSAICSTGLARLGLQFKAQIWEGVQSVQPRFEISKQGSIWLFFCFVLNWCTQNFTLTSAFGSYSTSTSPVVQIHWTFPAQPSDLPNLLNHLHLPKKDSIVHALTLTSGASYWELVGVVSHSQEPAGNLAPNHKTDEDDGDDDELDNDDDDEHDDHRHHWHRYHHQRAKVGEYHCEH